MNAAVQAVAQARADRQARYRELVRAAAGGREIDPEEVVDILDKFNKSEDDFQRDVDLVAARIAADAKMREVPALDKQVRDISAAEIAAATEFDKLAAAHAAKMAQFREQKKEIEHRATAIRSEHRQAFRVAPNPYPELAEACDKANRARGEIAKQLDALRDRTVKLRGSIDRAERAAANNVTTPNLHLPSMRRDMEDYDQTARELEERLRAADAEVARCEAALLVP